MPRPSPPCSTPPPRSSRAWRSSRRSSPSASTAGGPAPHLHHAAKGLRADARRAAFRGALLPVGALCRGHLPHQHAGGLLRGGPAAVWARTHPGRAADRRGRLRGRPLHRVRALHRQLDGRDHDLYRAGRRGARRGDDLLGARPARHQKGADHRQEKTARARLRLPRQIRLRLPRRRRGGARRRLRAASDDAAGGGRLRGVRPGAHRRFRKEPQRRGDALASPGAARHAR